MDKIRNSHKELVREEMKKSRNCFCKDIHNMSISDIINYREFLLKEKEIWKKENLIHKIDDFQSTINELSEYLFEFSLRLSNRTSNFRSARAIDKLNLRTKV